MCPFPLRSGVSFSGVRILFLRARIDCANALLLKRCHVWGQCTLLVFASLICNVSQMNMEASGNDLYLSNIDGSIWTTIDLQKSRSHSPALLHVLIALLTT